MNRTPFYNVLWKGKPPPGENPTINTHELKDMSEGLVSVKAVLDSVAGITTLMGGAKTVEKAASETIGEVNKTIEAAEELTDRLHPKPADTGSQIEGIRKTITEAKQLSDELNTRPKGEGEQKGERKFSVAADGQIALDPEGDFLFREALQYAAQLRGKEGKESQSYFYQDPESGDMKEAKGPTVIRQQAAPDVWMVDGNEVKKLAPGEPVIAKRPAPPADGDPARGGKTWVVQNGKVTEAEQGKPILIEQPAATPNIFQVLGSDGQPMQMTKDSFDMQIGVWKTMDEMRQGEEMHKAKVGLVKEVTENFSDIVGGARDVFESRRKGSGAKEKAPTQQKRARIEPDANKAMVACSWCEKDNEVVIGTEKFDCSSCGKPNDIVPAED